MTDEEIARAYQVPIEEVMGYRAQFGDGAGDELLTREREKVKNKLCLAADKAADTLVATLEGPEDALPSARKISVAQDVLDRTGFKAPERVQHTVSGFITAEVAQLIKITLSEERALVEP